jgi:hypothetical protein
MAMTTRPRAQAHNIYTLHRTTATTTRPHAQAHAIFNVTLHNGDNATRKRLQQHHMLTTSPIAHELFHIMHCGMATSTTRMGTTRPYIDYKPNSTQAMASNIDATTSQAMSNIDTNKLQRQT